MKKILVMLMAAALFFFPATVFSFYNTTPSMGINAGLVLPQGDADDFYDTGLTLGGHFLVPSTVHEQLLWGVAGGIGRLTGDFRMTMPQFDGSGTFIGTRTIKQDHTLITIEAAPTARFLIPMDGAVQNLFGQFGVGLLYGYFSNGDSDSETEIGISLGGGVAFLENLEAMALFKKYDDYEAINLTLGYNF